jgi:tRNA G18 (ribose-2'-O)-methylase SpoU
MKRSLRLLAWNVRSLWNVGSFFRTADALGVEKIYLTGYTGHPPRKEITKTALGAEEIVPWEHHTDPIPILEKLKREGWQIVALEQTDRSENLRTFKPDEKVCVVVGHELTGVPEELLELSDALVEIPMLGEKESLNVAVAAGIALYMLQNQLEGRP